jgi:quercetin 2,3-dioxygenase
MNIVLIANSMNKKIDHILTGREKLITRDESVIQTLPHQDFRFANPIIVIHHIRPREISAGSELRIHPHPHRGFAPVTFMLQGQGYHKDSAGHDALINAGDVQWMFAGKGIMHSEGPSEKLLREGGVHELIQIWVNVPARHKWESPSYQSASREQQPQVLAQDGVDLRLSSGVYEGQTGPLQNFTPVISIAGTIQKGKTVKFKASSGYWTLLYIARGKVNINREDIEAHQLIVFEKDNDEIILNAEEDTTVLFLSAEPIEEPIAAKDNFVMNTKEEIDQAIEDARNGAFGTLDF